jgi:MATE family multidrug resistance protein
MVSLYRPRAGWKVEFLGLMAIAGPLIVNRVGHMAMSVVDTTMAGILGSAEVASVGLGGIAFFFGFVFSMGLMMGVDPFISHAIGRDDVEARRQGWRAANWLVLPTSLFVIVAVLGAPFVLTAIGYDPVLVAGVRTYLSILALGAPATMAFMAWSTCLSAHGDTRVLTWIPIAANVINVVGNLLFTLGWFGFPRLGLAGIALSTVLCQWFEFVALVWVLRPGGPRGDLWEGIVAPARSTMASVVRLGFPVAVQYTAEFAGFGLSTLFIGYFGTSVLAGHHIALNFASITFTAALGISAAASARVGQAFGRKDADGIRAAAVVAWTSGAALAAFTGLLMLLFNQQIAWLYVRDSQTIQWAAVFISIAALFQFADTTQAIGFGVMRGMGDTFWPAVYNGVSYWGVGLPVGCWAAFYLYDTPEPIWYGLTGALFMVAIALLLRFPVRLRMLVDHGFESVESPLKRVDVGTE